MNMEFWNRVDSMVQFKETTLSKLWNATKINPHTAKGWRMQNRYPDAESLIKIANYLGVSMEWLMTGEEISMADDAYTKDHPETPTFTSANGKQMPSKPEEPSILVPIFSQKLSAGPGQEFLDESNVTGYLRFPKRMAKGVNPSMLGAAEVIGDSMEPLLYAGDLVIFAEEIVEDSGLYVLSFNGAVLVKRLSFNYMTDMLEIMSENTLYSPIMANIKDQGLRILGKVISWIHQQQDLQLRVETGW